MAQQYAGRGFADVSVEGKTVNILLGSDDAEVAQWRAQRRARWPSRARLAQDAAAEKERNAQPAGLAALMSYASDDDSDAAEPPPKKQRPQKPCLVMLHSGRCRRGDECAYAHDVDNVPTCRFFREPGGCRRGRGCKHAHRADPLAPARDAPGSLLARLLRHDVAAETGLALQCLTALLDATE